VIKRMYKFHIIVIKYLAKELFKKRTPKELCSFLGLVAKQYFSVLLNEYKMLFRYFDKHYREELKLRKKHAGIKTDLIRALKLLQLVEKEMKEKGMPRWKIRQFFRDFYNNGEVREDVINDLMNKINGEAPNAKV